VLAAGATGVAALVIAAAVVLRLHPSTPEVVATVAKPAVVNSTPGGIGATASRTSFALTANLFHAITPVVVSEVDVIEGSVVKAGQPLVRLDAAQIADSVQAVQLQLNQVQSALQQAQLNYRLTLRPEYSQLVAQYQGELAIDQEELQLAHGNAAVITSPIAGEVYSVSVVPGNVASPTKTLVQIVDESQLRVSAGIQLADMNSVKVGDHATLTFAAIPGISLSGIVVAISPRAAASGLNATVVVYANNLAQSPIPIGTKTFVHVLAQVAAPVTVPVIAVSNLTLDPAVYVITNGRVRRQPVTVGAIDDNRVQILDGLAGGRVVAMTGTQTLSDGQRVKVEKVVP